MPVLWPCGSCLFACKRGGNPGGSPSPGSRIPNPLAGAGRLGFGAVSGPLTRRKLALSAATVMLSALSPTAAKEADVQDNLDPLQLAEQAARERVDSWKVRAQDLGKRYLTLALVKVLGSSVVAGALAFVSLPLTAAVACAVALGLLSVHAIYATRLLKRKDAELRHAWIGNYRIRQRHLSTRSPLTTRSWRLWASGPSRIGRSRQCRANSARRSTTSRQGPETQKRGLRPPRR
jgi:hypothetical protein